MEYPRSEITPDEIERAHAELGLPPVEDDVAPGMPAVLQVITCLVMAVLLALAGYLLFLLFGTQHERDAMQIVSDALSDPAFWSAVGVGLLAQMIDGALGMAYGVTASSFLLAT